MTTAFDQQYFQTSYRDYFAQNPASKVAAYTAIVRRHLASGRLLEIGCAFGLYASAMAQFLEVTASDVSSYAVGQARARPDAHRVAWREGTLESLALPAGSFDGVAAFDVLEHIGAIDREMTRLHELLKPGGFLFLTVPVYDGPLGWLVRLLDRDPTHVHKWGRQRWKELAQRHGFVVREAVGMVRYGVGRRYLFAAHRRLADVGSALFLVLQKPVAEGGS